MCESLDTITSDEVSYLFLPLAHAFALLIQLLSFDVGGTVAYYGGDTKQIVPELQEVRPTYLPSVPRIFEKIYTLALGSQPPEVQEKMKAAAKLGVQVRDMRNRGEEVPAELLAPFEQAEEQLFANVRSIFGGNLKQAVTGAAPISKEILEFFYGAGVPVLEGYGMTETATVATSSTIADHRFGSVGRPLPGTEAKIAEDGELLLKGANIFGGYYKNEDASFGTVVDGWLHTGDLGSIDDDGYVYITGRKKDIIITAGGKNLTPANLENDMKQSRWVSQAVMHGDRRPYPVMLITLDEEEIVPWAQGEGIDDTSIAALATGPEGARAHPVRARRRQREVRAGRADQEVLHPRPRPHPGDGRADADAEGQAQRRQREVRRRLRRALRRARLARAEGDGEARAAERRVADRDVGVVVAGLLRDERQAQPAAGAVGAVDARERREDALALGAPARPGRRRRRAGPGPRRRARRLERDVHLPAGAAVAHRVGDEVADQQAQARLPALDRDGVVGQVGPQRAPPDCAPPRR